jgi:two-component system, sensor histidine kinase PdtaS
VVSDVYHHPSQGPQVLTAAVREAGVEMVPREPSGSTFTPPPVPLTEERFHLAVEAASVAMIMVDRQGRIVLANPQAGRLFGYSSEELLEQTAEGLIPERFRSSDPNDHITFFDHPETRPAPIWRDRYGLRKDGTEVPLEIGLTPISGSEGSFVLVSLIDLTERMQAAAQMQASLQEKEVLLREVHHRVKNNLQVIASLLNLQADLIPDEHTRGLLFDTQARVRSMALIHDKFSRSTSLSQINLGDYLRELVAELFRAYRPPSVQYDLDAEPISVNIDTAIPCGLIASELISNCLKHAFPEGRSGRVRVTLETVAPAVYAMLVQDDGVGVPENFAAIRGESLGLQLIDTLARQLGTSLQVDQEGGSTFRLRFQETRYKTRT